MKGKKPTPASLAQLRKIGIVERTWSPAQRSGFYWRGAYRWIPRLNLWIKLCCLVSLLAALACLLLVFTRPRPTLLVSFPDGVTVCALPPLDPSTGKIIPRPSREDDLCSRLAIRSGRADDQQNAEFSKVVQTEPPAQKRASLEENIRLTSSTLEVAPPPQPVIAPPLQNQPPAPLPSAPPDANSQPPSPLPSPVGGV